MQAPIIGTLLLGVLVFVMYMLARVAKKRMGIGAGTIAGDALKIVGKKPLDQKSNLFVIEIAGGRHILLASSLEGHVVKLDDISSDEYAAMVDSDAVAAATTRPKLKLAMPVLRPNGAAAKAAPVQAAVEPVADVTAAPVHAIDDVDPDAIVAASAAQAQADADAAAEAEAEEQRFATVGESFQLLLGKAKDARAARKGDRASGE